MTTRLEYLIAHYLGQPKRSYSHGVSYWTCPICESSAFHTLPDKPALKHRAKCHGCDYLADACDLLKEFHPDESYSERLDRLDAITPPGKSSRSQSQRRDLVFWYAENQTECKTWTTRNLTDRRVEPHKRRKS